MNEVQFYCINQKYVIEIITSVFIISIECHLIKVCL